MYTSNSTFSVTDLRHKTTKVLEEVKNQGVIRLVNRSKTEAALVDIEYLNALQEGYEDYLDTLEFDKTVNLKRVPFEEYLKKRAKKQSKK